MKKYTLLLISTVLFSGMIAQIPPGYYSSATGLTGSALQMALHNIIDGHNSVSYASLWTHFQNTDKKPSGKVWDIYSDLPSGTPPYEFTFVSDQCGSYSGESDCYNREHSWPQSWFSSATTPSSDLFHVYPTDGYVNNQRGNLPYGTVGTPIWTSMNGSKRGYCVDPGYGSMVFEPIDEYKGDVARSFFYMSTRYLTEDASWTTSFGTNKSVILPWEASVLLNWSHLDPVSTKEIDRNNDIYGIQNNRNPFIDHPEWADSIWAMIATGFEQEIAANLSVGIYPNPSSDVFYISNESRSDLKADLRITNALGQIIENHLSVLLPALNNESFAIDSGNWEKGIYYITILEKQKIRTLRFIKI
jgi:endonuclease I